MPATQNIQATINWANPFINYQPLTIGGIEPALSIANIVLQTILGPPFTWRWNRASTSFVATQTGPTWNQDYVKALADFGFIEKAWAVTADGKTLVEFTVKSPLSASLEGGRPQYISAQTDDNAGNITFRLMPVPNAAYTINVLYQKKARLLQGLSQSWSPIPDEYGYIYNWGYLALASVLAGDPRFPIFNDKFIAHLLGAQDGLDATQRNIFLGNWLEITKAAQRATLETQQGTAARQK